jgi:hypothetical protein
MNARLKTLKKHEAHRSQKINEIREKFFRTRSRLWALPQTWPLTRGGGADWALLPIGLRLEAQYDFLKR